MFFRFVTTGTLDALRRDAGLLPFYRVRETELLERVDAFRDTVEKYRASNIEAHDEVGRLESELRQAAVQLAQADATAERLRRENESLVQLKDPQRAEDGRWNCVCQAPPHQELTLCADPREVAAVIGELHGDAAPSIRDTVAAGFLRSMLRAHFATSPAEPGAPYYAVALVIGGVLDTPAATAPVPASPTREELDRQIGETPFAVAAGERGPEELDKLRTLLRAYFAAAPELIDPRDRWVRLAQIVGGVIDTSTQPYLLLA